MPVATQPNQRGPRSTSASRNESAIRREFRSLLTQNPKRALAQMGQGGKITLNADDLFMLCPLYAENPDQRPMLGPQLYSIAREFIDRTYEALLSRRRLSRGNTVVFTAGGSASGKSTILRGEGKRPEVDFLVDTTFSDTDRALAQVDRALRANRRVEIYYVHREFGDCVVSMVERAHDRASGRLVPIDDMARTHFGAQHAILAAYQKYQGNRCVLIRLSKNEGRQRLSLLRLQELVQHLHRSVDALQQLGQSVLDELYESSHSQRARGRKNYRSRRLRIPVRVAIYEAARSNAQKAGTTSRKGNAGPRKPRAKKSAR